MRIGLHPHLAEHVHAAQPVAARALVKLRQRRPIPTSVRRRPAGPDKCADSDDSRLARGESAVAKTLHDDFYEQMVNRARRMPGSPPLLLSAGRTNLNKNGACLVCRQHHARAQSQSGRHHRARNYGRSVNRPAQAGYRPGQLPAHAGYRPGQFSARAW